MDWQEEVVVAAVAKVLQEPSRRRSASSIKIKAGAIAGRAAAGAVWPKVLDEVRRWLEGLEPATA